MFYPLWVVFNLDRRTKVHVFDSSESYPPPGFAVLPLEKRESCGLAGLLIYCTFVNDAHGFTFSDWERAFRHEFHMWGE